MLDLLTYLLDESKKGHAAWMQDRWADAIARMGLRPVPPVIPPDTPPRDPEPMHDPFSWLWKFEVPHGSLSLDRSRLFSGTWEGREIRIRIEGNHVEVDLDGGSKLPTSWWIRKAFQRGLHDATVGDPDFDHSVHFGGEATEVIAFLDPAARSDLIQQIGRSETLIRDGRIFRSIPLGWTADSSILVRCLREMASFGERLQPAGTPAERLLHNATSDPVLAVRLNNLRTLQEKLGYSAEALAASRHARVHGEPVERLQGALYLGDEGLDTLAALAEMSRFEESLRERALRGYIERAPRDRGIELLRRLLLQAPLPEHLVATAVDVLVRLPVDEALPVLDAVASRADPTVAAKLAPAIAAAHHPAAESILLGLLSRPYNYVLHQAAAAGLGAVGTVRAIEALLAVEAAAGSAPERRVMRQAILRIQSRLRDAKAGTLSIATIAEEAGTLSLAPEPGGLAIATDALADDVTPESTPPAPESGG